MYMSRNRSWNRNRNCIRIKCWNRSRNRLQIFRFRNPGKGNGSQSSGPFGGKNLKKGQEREENVKEKEEIQKKNTQRSRKHRGT
jgi:hypothetical protein